MIALRRFLTRLKQLAKANEGVAAVEFALILPFLLTLYMGSIELSEVIIVDRRLSIAAGAVGDLVARSESQITQAALDDYFAAAEATLTPYDADGLMQVVTSVYVDGNGNGTVRWSVGHNGGTARLAGSVYPMPTATQAIIRNTYLIVSEASYSYTPLVGYVFPEPLSLYKEVFHLPRFGTEIVLAP